MNDAEVLPAAIQHDSLSVRQDYRNGRRWYTYRNSSTREQKRTRRFGNFWKLRSQHEEDEEEALNEVVEGQSVPWTSFQYQQPPRLATTDREHKVD